MKKAKEYTTTIHLYPSKMRRACYGLDKNGNVNDGFFIKKRKYDYKNSDGKMINYTLCYSANGMKTESTITEETFNSLKKEAKINFDKMFDVIEKGEKLEKTHDN